MKKNYIFPILLLGTAILFSSCNGSTTSTETMEARLIGDTWSFDDVCFNPKGATPSSDVTENWDQYRINFFQDYTLDWVDTDAQDTLPGFWYVYEDYEWDAEDQQSELVQTLEITVYEPGGNGERYIVWEDPYVGTKRIKARQKTGTGTYKFDLRR